MRINSTAASATRNDTPAEESRNGTARAEVRQVGVDDADDLAQLPFGVELLRKCHISWRARCSRVGA
jgi:hypothetical protein